MRARRDPPGTAARPFPRGKGRAEGGLVPQVEVLLLVVFDDDALDEMLPTAVVGIRADLTDE